MGTPLVSYVSKIPEPGDWSVRWVVGDVVSWVYGDDEASAHLFVAPSTHGSGRHLLQINGYTVAEWTATTSPPEFRAY